MNVDEETVKKARGVWRHKPVMCEELVESLNIQAGGIYVDATAGYGGHGAAVWDKLSSSGVLILCDRDEEAVEYLKKLFAQKSHERTLKGESPPKYVVIHELFSRLEEVLKNLGVWSKVSGVYADLGVSSPQLDQGRRGFSFQKEGPVDMRMGKNGLSAAQYLRSVSEQELMMILREHGEEPRAKAIARGIVRYRDRCPALESTVELAEVIRNASGYKKSHKHPATRSFQAIRMIVNEEVRELHELLSWSFDALAHRGRFVAISFHSLEDSAVKHRIKDLLEPAVAEILHDRDFVYQGFHPLCRAFEDSIEIIKPFPMKPSLAEIQQNPRSRSATLRCYEKMPSVLGGYK